MRRVSGADWGQMPLVSHSEGLSCSGNLHTEVEYLWYTIQALLSFKRSS